MNLLFENCLFWTCSDLRLQQNLRESTIGQQHTLRNNSMNFGPQRPLLAEVVHVTRIPPRLCIVHTVCRRDAQRSPILYSVRERVLWRRLAKKIMNMDLLTAINGQSQRAESWLRWTSDCVCYVLCMLHEPVGDRVSITMWFCASWILHARRRLCVLFLVLHELAAFKRLIFKQQSRRRSRFWRENCFDCFYRNKIHI